jgi:hypothetical protein
MGLAVDDELGRRSQGEGEGEIGAVQRPRLLRLWETDGEVYQAPLASQWEPAWRSGCVLSLVPFGPSVAGPTQNIEWPTRGTPRERLEDWRVGADGVVAPWDLCRAVQWTSLLGHRSRTLQSQWGASFHEAGEQKTQRDMTGEATGHPCPCKCSVQCAAHSQCAK